MYIYTFISQGDDEQTPVRVGFWKTWAPRRCVMRLCEVEGVMNDEDQHKRPSDGVRAYGQLLLLCGQMARKAP